MDSSETINSLSVQNALGKKLEKYTRNLIREWYIKSRNHFAFILEAMSKHMVIVLQHFLKLLFCRVLGIIFFFFAYRKERKTLSKDTSIQSILLSVEPKTLMSIFTVEQSFIVPYQHFGLNDKICRFLLFLLSFQRRFLNFNYNVIITSCQISSLKIKYNFRH